jgi:hypothetical protein
MQPSSKGKKKKSDALYYVMTQALSIYTLCNYGVVYIEKREAKRNTLKGRESGKGWQNGTRRIALHRGVQLAHLCCNESGGKVNEERACDFVRSLRSAFGVEDQISRQVIT